MTGMQEFILPDLGEGLVEATIVEWRVAPGDEVAVDQIVVEVESEKSVVELPTPYAGRVAALGAQQGETLRAGDVLLSVAPVDAPLDALEGAADGAAGSGGPSGDAGTGGDAGSSRDAGPGSAADVGRGWSGEPDGGASRGDEPGGDDSGAVLIGYGTSESTTRLRRPEGGRFRRRRGGRGPQPVPSRAAPASAALLDERRSSPVMSPLVRREAQAEGFDARHLEGSGPNGLVLREDVRAAAELLRAAPAPEADAGAQRPPAGAPGPQSGASAPQPAPQSGAPRHAARAAQPPADAAAAPSAAASAAAATRIPVEGMRGIIAEHMAESHATVPKATVWLDVDATPLLELRARLQEDAGERFSLTTLIARIVVAGLRAHPRLNASFDAERDEILEYGGVNLGIAAQTPRGLSVPVVHGAEGMTLRELRDAIGELVAEAPRGRYAPGQLQGGTFTLNNYGAFGVDGSSPIINLPQAAMLGIGRLKERPWVVDGELAVRTAATVSFVFDHRVCDGGEASAFLTFVTDRIERPALLYADL
ncbi:dihydrolipoamide acetyltransferase family protein [Gulosibacter sp. 10]|uniref:dihydrolipoamide acetyltransferase family protein n=1 Tax=Gulosibacter sp. 10 TaxID=1255570 RepID=UPI00097EDD5F|nr:dihydrolipoamide acetyltransferase family protein [Gulosibacter sp. 10]SJM55692.1 Dihydrolipoamide acyltransferase component of branched-chain alpha-keto acid dehydrogenase complex [Gulosibacter sp. 10]